MDCEYVPNQSDVCVELAVDSSVWTML